MRFEKSVKKNPHFTFFFFKLKKVQFVCCRCFLIKKKKIIPNIYVLFYAKTILQRNFFTKSLQSGQADCNTALGSGFVAVLVSPFQARPLPAWVCAPGCAPALEKCGPCSTCCCITLCLHLHWKSSIRYFRGHASVIISHRIVPPRSI